MAQVSCLSDNAEERQTVEDALLCQFEVSRSFIDDHEIPVERKANFNDRHGLSRFGISRIDFRVIGSPPHRPPHNTMKALFIEQTEGPPGKVLFPLSKFNSNYIRSITLCA